MLISINDDKVLDIPIPTTEEALNQILAAIAAEELSLSDLINAEADKIRSILGILPGQAVRQPTIDELERINRAVDKVLKDIIKKEIILSIQTGDILDFLSTSSTTTTTTTASTTTTTRSTTTTTRSTTTTTRTTTSTTRTSTTTTRRSCLRYTIN